MQSRFTAFAIGDAAYLLGSWHSSTRPSTVALDDTVAWTQLDVLATVAGGPFDTYGIVEFRARHRRGQLRGVLHERSTFSREDGRWFYVAGETGSRFNAAATSRNTDRNS
jgi:SEC-C motif-containing protein